MAKFVLSLFIKMALFAVVMFTVVKIVPYDGLVSLITGLFDYPSADSFTRFILGEPDIEVWESLRAYFEFTINILISIAAINAMLTIFKGLTSKVTPAHLAKECVLFSLRLFMKILAFIFLFWVLFRFLPYQFVFPVGKTYSIFTLISVAFFNLLLTMACYEAIRTKIINKRSL